MEAFSTTIECDHHTRPHLKNFFAQSSNNEPPTEEEYFRVSRALESDYYDTNVPRLAQLECFTLITPRFDNNSAEIVASRLSAKFEKLGNTSQLTGLWLPDNENWKSEKFVQLENETRHAAEYQQLNLEIKNRIYHKTLKNITNHVILAKAMEEHGLRDSQYHALLNHAKSLSLDDKQQIPILRAQLRRVLLTPNRKKWNLKTRAHVTQLLQKLEINPYRKNSEAYYHHYLARHLIACNELVEANKSFDTALDYSLLSNHGRLTGEIALNRFACFLATNKFIPNNHERYYRYVMEYPVVEYPSGEINDVAEAIENYFWKDLYRPYPGLKRLTRSNPV